MNSDGKVSDQNRNLIAYYKLKNGQILKIDRQHYTCYIFNIQLQLWQEDSVLFDEFQNGNLDGHELDFKENYSIGEPIRKRRLL